MTVLADNTAATVTNGATGSWLSARRARWLAAILAIAVGVIDLVITAAHGLPIRHDARLSARLIRAVLGAQYLLPAAGVTLVWLSRGLLHAKRNAWSVAGVAAAASLIAAHAHHQDLLGVPASALLLVLLIIARGSFRAPHDPARPRDAARLLLVGGVVVFVYGVLGLYLLDSQFTSSTSVVDAIVDAVGSMLLVDPPRLDPMTLHGRWLLASIHVGVLIVVLTAAARLILTFARPAPPSERRTVSELLERWADTPLAAFHLLDDKSWFITADRTAFVGYSLVGNTAVALGEPVGSPDRRADAARQFCEFCQLNGWTPTFHQVTADGAPALATVGLRLVKIGEEAIVPVQTWTLDGPEHKTLRSALRRVERQGYDTVELPRPIDDAILHELRRVSDSWLADANHRERTFTVGQFDTHTLRTATVIAVRHRDTGRIAAFANVVDSYHSPNGNFDLMRRDPTAPNGVMECLFVALITRFHDHGMTGMTLGLAPMANVAGNSVPQRAMRMVYERGESLFNYQGLRKFKDKWDPRWEPRYVAYQSDTDLPKIALAIARAGELPNPQAWLGRMRRIGRQLPATLTLATILIWFMAATNHSPQLHQELIHHIGFSWRDLVHLQLWRLPASQLAETSPGYVWANVALFLCVLPIAEWRLGTTRTMAVFFLADWASTLTTLVALRLDTPWSHWAAHIIQTRDAGPSSGAWALAITVALTLRRPKPRAITSATVIAFLSLALIIHHRLFDTQHALAALAAGSAVLLTRQRRTATDTIGAPAKQIKAPTSPGHRSRRSS